MIVCILMSRGITTAVMAPSRTTRTATAIDVAAVQVPLAPEILVIAQTASIGDLTSIWTPMTMKSCTWLTSLVDRVTRLGVPNFPTSGSEKFRTFSNTSARILRETLVPMTAVQ